MQRTLLVISVIGAIGCGEPRALEAEHLQDLRALGEKCGCGEEELAACCDECWDAVAGEQPGGKVCCCDCGGCILTPVACSFADRYPGQWNGPALPILDRCIQEHEQGHVDEGEGSCVGAESGDPAHWEPGDDPATCEANQYANEVACLRAGRADCRGNANCERIIDERIRQLTAGTASDSSAPSSGP